MKKTFPSEYRAAINFALKQLGGQATQAAKDKLQEDYRLKFLYHGHYVAYSDIVEIVKRVHRLRRRIIKAGPTLSAIHEAIAALPPREQAHIRLVYVEQFSPDDLPLTYSALADRDQRV